MTGQRRGLVWLVSARGGWRARAACLEADPELFYPRNGDTAGAVEAVNFCRARCTVRQACLDEALARSEFSDFGIWGGYTQQERARLRRKLRKQAS